jgi:hypothetical protein
MRRGTRGRGGRKSWISTPIHPKEHIRLYLSPGLKHIPSNWLYEEASERKKRHVGQWRVESERGVIHVTSCQKAANFGAQGSLDPHRYLQSWVNRLIVFVSFILCTLANYFIWCIYFSETTSGVTLQSLTSYLTSNFHFQTRWELETDFWNWRPSSHSFAGSFMLSLLLAFSLRGCNSVCRWSRQNHSLDQDAFCLQERL